MGQVNKFFFFKNTAKRGFMIAADRVNAVEATDSNTLNLDFANLGNHRDGTQGELSFDFSPDGSIEDFLQELFSASARNPFVVIAYDEAGDGTASQYKGTAVTISNAI